MPAQPEMAGESYHGMSMSDAMDLVDEHGITQKNYKDVCTAAEMVFGEEDTSEAPEGGSEDQAMLDAAYASDRKR